LALFREDEDDELLNEDNNDDELHENDSMSDNNNIGSVALLICSFIYYVHV